MDDRHEYIKLFLYLKENKWDDFVTNIGKIDDFNPNIRDDQNNYFLNYAIMYNNINITKLLIQKGAKLDISDNDNKPILFIPIKYGYNDIMKTLLMANSESIGISIIDMKDSQHRTALHYAIKLKNKFAVELLLKHKSNPNIPDGNGYNALHYAVYSRDIDMCKLIIEYIVNINARCNTGETALHIACNFQQNEIVKLLLSKNAIINIQDYEHEFSPIHYAINLNNNELLLLLIKENVNLNIQDVFGNTPMHYIMIEENYHMIDILIDSKLPLNFNLWNIEGKLPLHLLLENYSTDNMYYVDKILEKTNVSFRDNTGISCLYMLVKLGIWKSYKNILSKKKLDILTKNKNGFRIIDEIPQKSYDEFIDMVVMSYYNRLKKLKDGWEDEWKNMCSRDFNMDDALIKKNKLTSEDLKDKKCNRLIKSEILKLIELKSNDTCTNNSYPIGRAKTCISLSEGEHIGFCTFTGSTLDVLIGLIYLLQKHKNVCSTLSHDFSENANLCSFYRSIGIIVNSRCEFLNFEIVWVNQKLFLVEQFYEKINKCKSKNVKFIIVPLGIEMENGTHANYLIYDIPNNTVERFEPHGSSYPSGFNYNPSLLDEVLKIKFMEINEDIKYISPKEYLPKIGFQMLDILESHKKKIGDPGGFCALWNIWYTDMRLTHKDVPCKELVKMLIRSIKNQNVSVKNMIRNYGKFIIEKRDDILKKADLDINDWLNDQVSDTQIDNVLAELKDEIDKL
uniref:Uncharacterized protein n=1 Tax=viral metagenome TaxID=1070528 RepID=A0A6C0EBH3_9ZZZZ